MEAISPVFAALGIVEDDMLNDLAHWLDGYAGPTGTAEAPDWRNPAGPVAQAARRSAGKEA